MVHDADAIAMHCISASCEKQYPFAKYRSVIMTFQTDKECEVLWNQI